MSGKICAVVNCHSSYRFLKLWTKTRCVEHVEQLHEDCPCLQPFSFRRFPKNPELRKEWLRVINRKDFLPTDNSVVCSKHFIDGSRIPQLEMGYEKKVGVGHNHFAKSLAPLHKKRKMRHRNTWNGNHLGEENISLCTLDRLHTIIQLKKRKEKASLGLIPDYEVKPKQKQHVDSQQGPSWFGGSLTVVKTESDEAVVMETDTDLLLRETPLPPPDDYGLGSLFDDSSRGSFYGGYDRSLCMSPTTMSVEMSETLEVGLCLVHVPGDAREPYDATTPWFEDIRPAGQSEPGPADAHNTIAVEPSTSDWCRSEDEAPPCELAETSAPSPHVERDESKREGSRPKGSALNCRICGAGFECPDSFRSHLLDHMADSDKSYVL